MQLCGDLRDEHLGKQTERHSSHRTRSFGSGRSFLLGDGRLDGGRRLRDRLLCGGFLDDSGFRGLLRDGGLPLRHLERLGSSLGLGSRFRVSGSFGFRLGYGVGDGIGRSSGIVGSSRGIVRRGVAGGDSIGSGVLGPFSGVGVLVTLDRRLCRAVDNRSGGLRQLSRGVSREVEGGGVVVIVLIGHLWLTPCTGH